MAQEETQAKEEVRGQIIKKEKQEMKKDLMEKVDKTDLQILEVNQNLIVRIDQTDHQEMERKKVLVLKENQVLEIDHQKMEKKKVLVLKENQVLEIDHQEMERKKVLLKKKLVNHLVLQTIQSTLGKKRQKIYLLMDRKKVLVLKVRKNLKAEIVDLKILALKNTVKKELNLKIF